VYEGGGGLEANGNIPQTRLTNVRLVYGLQVGVLNIALHEYPHGAQQVRVQTATIVIHLVGKVFYPSRQLVMGFIPNSSSIQTLVQFVPAGRHQMAKHLGLPN